MRASMPQPGASSWQLPPAMADTAPPVDSAYGIIFWFSVFFTVLITAVTLYFVVKYSRREGVASQPTGQFNRLEILWTVTPTILIGFLFHVGYAAYIKNATAAEGATEIRVRAHKWSWEFEYPSGDRVAGELTLEKGRPYKLILSSEDVLHSFFIPEFRMKRDAVPGQYSFIQFTPTVAGTAQVFCAEFCGTSHSAMLATVRILEPEEYRDFEKATDPPTAEMTVEWGEKLFTKNACPVCHGVEGSGLIAGSKSPGPKLAGIYDTMQPMSTGGSVLADANYIRESMLRPNARIVAGYTTVQMPAFVMKDAQLDAIISYVKTLK